MNHLCFLGCVSPIGLESRSRDFARLLLPGSSYDNGCICAVLEVLCR